MADWIFQGNRRYSDLDASVAASREHGWGTPGFQGSNVPVPPEVAAALAARAAPRMEPLPPQNG